MKSSSQASRKRSFEHQSSLKATIKEIINKKCPYERSPLQRSVSTTSPSLDMQQRQLQLLEAIEECASPTHQGFFKYQNWVKFNYSQFAHVGSQTVSNLWKIIRIINHGSVVIPTGLIYDIAFHFINKGASLNKQASPLNLKAVINEFLRLNKTSEFINNFRELSNYPSLQSIQRIYCRISIQQGMRTSNNASNNVHTRLFNDNRMREQSIRQLKYASLAQQLQQCKFAPSINHYQRIINSQKKRQRVCNCYIPRGQSTEAICNKQFVALPIDKKIFEGDLSCVPGAQEHIKRVEWSQAERQRIKRITSGCCKF